MTLRILVVDDATFIRDTIKRTVRRMIPEVEVLEAIDGRRAMAALKANSVDMILSDWEMPEMSGDEFLAWVRAHPQHAETPFIMVTSRGDRNHVMQAVQAGVSDYLTKPFTPEELQRKVAKQLKRIGYKPKAAVAGNQLSGIGSVDALTNSDPARVLSRQASEASEQKGAEQKPAASAPKLVNSHYQGKAWLRFPTQSYPCEVREISLQGMSALLERPAIVPRVFDQVAVDLEDEHGETLARINAYIHSVAAMEPNPDAKTLRVSARFVDDDPQKLDILSRIIA